MVFAFIFSGNVKSNEKLHTSISKRLHSYTNQINTYSYLFIPTHCRCRGLLLYLITLKDTHTHALGRTPLSEWSARHKELYLTSHKRHKPMPPAWFEPAISASERPHTYALDHAATGIALIVNCYTNLKPEQCTCVIGCLLRIKEEGKKHRGLYFGISLKWIVFTVDSVCGPSDEL
jgi:hypothetical protein